MKSIAFTGYPTRNMIRLGYHLLEQIASFGFEDQMGRSFTARRSRRKQEWYWYAHIYQRLGVSTRYQAMMHAKMLQLL